MKFRNEYAFLSNMYPAEIRCNGMKFKCVESAFQAFKTSNVEIQKSFQDLTGPEAKRLGRRIKLRPGWERQKIKVMAALVQIKFHQHPDLLKKLLEINEEIVEDNTWKDTFWGRYNGYGENHLGKILMNIQNCTEYHIVTSDKEEAAVRARLIKKGYTPEYITTLNYKDRNKREFRELIVFRQ